MLTRMKVVEKMAWWKGREVSAARQNAKRDEKNQLTISLTTRFSAPMKTWVSGKRVRSRSTGAKRDEVKSNSLGRLWDKGINESVRTRYRTGQSGRDGERAYQSRRGEY